MLAKSQHVDPILDPLLSIEAFCYGATRNRRPEKREETDFSSSVLDSIQHFIGENVLSSKITVLEGMFSSTMQSLREECTLLLDATNAGALCHLLENLLISPNFTQSELMISLCAITAGVKQTFSHVSTTLATLVNEKEQTSASEMANAEELETLQLNFYSLQKKCSALLQIHENYKEEKETQLLEALQQCGMLKTQVEEAASYSYNFERTSDEVKKLTLALTQAERALEIVNVRNEVEKTRMEKDYLHKIHNLNDSIKLLKDQSASEAEISTKKLHDMQQCNRKLEESFESERDRLNDEIEDKSKELVQLQKTLENQLFVITELKQENEHLVESVDNFTAVIKTKEERVKAFEDQNDQDTLTIDQLSSELRVIRKAEADLRRQLESVNTGEHTENDSNHDLNICEDQFHTITQLKEIIENQKLSITVLKAGNKELQGNIDSCHSALTLKEVTISDLRVDLERCENDIMVLKSVFDAAKEIESISCEQSSEKCAVGCNKIDTNNIHDFNRQQPQGNTEKLDEETVKREEERTELTAFIENNDTNSGCEFSFDDSDRDSVDDEEEVGEEDEDDIDDVMEQGERDLIFDTTDTNADHMDCINKLPSHDHEHQAPDITLDVHLFPPSPPPVSSASQNMHEHHSAPHPHPIILLDIGSFTSHVGVWNTEDKCFAIRYSCPSVVTRPTNKQTSAISLLQGASSLAGPMYNSFRSQNALAGQDAWYCAYSHPDAGLRGALSVSRPISGEGVVSDKEGFKLLLTHCLEKVWEGDVEGVLRTEETQVIISHLSSFTNREFKFLADILLEDNRFARMSLMSQPILASMGFGVPSLLVVDIGAYSTRVVPVYESYCLSQCVATSHVGGEHMTEYMELLLHAQKQEQYSSLLLRRRQQLAREIKENHCFIASSFEECVEMYGTFQFASEKVMHDVCGGEAMKSSEGTTENTSDIEVTECFTLADGSSITVTVDRELFYCPEVLFSPSLLDQCAEEASIVDSVVTSVRSLDDSIRTEISQTILITGNSSQLEGLTERLETVLRQPLANLGVVDFVVVSGPSSSSSSSTSALSDKEAAINENMSWLGSNQVVLASILAEKKVSLPNSISLADFEKGGESTFASLYT